MTYVASDIHGEYKKYIQMLNKINFSDSDILYVLGDVIDRGSEPIKVLEDMSMRHNICPVIGNHEFMAIGILEKLLTEITKENCDIHISSDICNELLEWKQNGGETTLNQLKVLSNEKCKAMLDYLKRFSTLEVTRVGKKTYVLVHAGFISYSPQKHLSDYTPEEVAFCRPDYDRKVFRNKSWHVISGHTPTFYMSGKTEIYYSNNNICIDCGAVFGGELACLRLDDMREFYV